MAYFSARYDAMQVLGLYPLQSVYITSSVPSDEGCVEQGL